MQGDFEHAFPFHFSLKKGWHDCRVSTAEMKRYNLDVSRITEFHIGKYKPSGDVAVFFGDLCLKRKEPAKILAGMTSVCRRIRKMDRKFFSSKMREQADRILRFHGEMEKSPGNVNADLSAARGEGESIQLIVYAPCGLKKARVTIPSTPVAKDGKELPLSSISVAPVGFIQCDPPCYAVTRSGLWPDPILTYATTLDVAPGIWQSWFLDINVPTGQKSGVYHGTVLLRAEKNLKRILPFTLKVRNFSLPEAYYRVPGNRPILFPSFDIHTDIWK